MMVHRSVMPALQAISMALCLQTLDVVAFLPPVSKSISRSIVNYGIVPSTSINDNSSQQLRVIQTSNNLRSSYTTSLFSQPSSATPVEEEEEEKELTPATIAEMIEVSFLQSCMQLSQGYIDVLKLFIVAVKAGYERDLSLGELHQLVVDCPVNSAGRDLVKEELGLRLEWMRVVYELLIALDVPGGEAGVVTAGGDEDLITTRVTGVVSAMLTLLNALQNEEETTGGKQDASVTLSNLTADQALERSSSLSKLHESFASSPMDKAFLINDIRVALVTFRVLEEEKVCIQDRIGTSGGGKLEEEETVVPRPPIPGTGANI